MFNEFIVGLNSLKMSLLVLCSFVEVFSDTASVQFRIKRITLRVK
jgi:hypothetical protein